MRSQGACLKLGVELCAEHKRMFRARELGYFHQYTIGRGAGEDKPSLLEALHVRRINLVTMTMALFDKLFFVRSACHSSLLQIARICTETHGATVFIIRKVLFLLQHHIYHWIDCCFLDFRRIRVFKLQHIACILYYHQLHTIAETKIRNFMLACKLYRLHLPFYTSLAET